MEIPELIKPVLDNESIEKDEGIWATIASDNDLGRPGVKGKCLVKFEPSHLVLDQRGKGPRHGRTQESLADKQPYSPARYWSIRIWKNNSYFQFGFGRGLSGAPSEQVGRTRLRVWRSDPP